MKLALAKIANYCLKAIRPSGHNGINKMSLKFRIFVRFFAEVQYPGREV
jgi:hypothetical protein